MKKINFKSIIKIGAYLTIAILVGVTVSYAGNLTPPGAPAKTMYTLGDLHTLITTGTTTAATDFDTPGSVSATFYSIDDLVGAFDDLVKSGNTVAASSSAQGTSLVMTIPQGYYTGAASVTVSTSSDNFIAANIKSGTNLLGITGTAPGAQLLQTRQTACYDVSGASISCTSTGQDGESLKGFTHSYTDNGEATSTITDNATGLIWQKCASGLSGTNCGTGSAAQATWANALTYCNSNTAQLPGSGWRLPNAMELHSLVDYSKTSSPMINTDYFPATPDVNATWSSTSVGPTLTSAYSVTFNAGGIGSAAKGAPLGYTRCVRG